MVLGTSKMSSSLAIPELVEECRLPLETTEAVSLLLPVSTPDSEFELHELIGGGVSVLVEEAVPVTDGLFGKGLAVVEGNMVVF